MKDRTRINILKGVLLITAGVGLLNATQVKRLQKDNNRLRRQGGIAGRIINRFTELSSEETCTKIVEEFEFYWVTKDVEDIQL
jgi:hypothetical protein